MKLTGLHLLLTYQCTFECDHCFVWGSPFQSGTMTLEIVRHILSQGQGLGSVHSIYFEGGEAFIYYPILVRGVELALEMGFTVGIVSNAFWATSLEDAQTWLEPFAGKLSDLSVSSDLFHYSELLSQQAQRASEAAQALGIPVGVISIARQSQEGVDAVGGQIQVGESRVMFRGRAAEKLAPFVAHHPWETFTRCPYEDLAEPGRVHVDPLGNIHLCQGIVIGNLFEQPLKAICESYDPASHPIVAPILAGGPRQLVEEYELTHEDAYADACHLCYRARQALRERFPRILAPGQVYGIIG
jgi:MoaA/NifB/PqqE/SkfB family radical SAM enzyme